MHERRIGSGDENADQEERRGNFNEVAETRYAQIVTSGKTVPWHKMRTYLEDRLAGKTVTRPVARKMAR